MGLGPDEDYDDFDVPEQRQQEIAARPPQRVRPSGPPPGPPPRRPAPPPADRGYDDPDGGVVRPLPMNSPQRPTAPQRDSGRPRAAVRPLGGPSNAAATKPVRVTPSNFNDAQEIADIFKRRQPVIVNLEDADRDLRRRIIDFSSGVCYGLGGSMERVAGDVYLITPSEVEVAPDERRRLSEFE